MHPELKEYTVGELYDSKYYTILRRNYWLMKNIFLLKKQIRSKSNETIEDAEVLDRYLRVSGIYRESFQCILGDDEKIFDSDNIIMAESIDGRKFGNLQCNIREFVLKLVRDGYRDNYVIIFDKIKPKEILDAPDGRVGKGIITLWPTIFDKKRIFSEIVEYHARRKYETASDVFENENLILASEPPLKLRYMFYLVLSVLIQIEHKYHNVDGDERFHFRRVRIEDIEESFEKIFPRSEDRDDKGLYEDIVSRISGPIIKKLVDYGIIKMPDAKYLFHMDGHIINDED